MSVVTARPFLRVSAVFPKHDHERLKDPAARWQSRSVRWGGRFTEHAEGLDVTSLTPVTLPPPPPPAESGHLPPHLCTTAPIPHPTCPHPPVMTVQHLFGPAPSPIFKGGSPVLPQHLSNGPRLQASYQENSVDLHPACLKL